MPTNPLLQEERDRATFVVEAMINLIDGGAERTKRRREIEGWILNDPAWRHEPLEYLTRNQVYGVQLHKAAMAVRLMKEREIDDPYEQFYIKRTAYGRQSAALDLHTIMFIPAILGQGTDEQVERWLGPAIAYNIIGTYAQTEMGHGTFLRGIETTATYDPSNEEFVLHSPTTTSIKWWPGSLGKTTNHALVIAQLHTQGRCYGAHLFVMRIRDQETHAPLPGIELGDIGPKFGYAAIDNGYMRLRHVRVPRDHMLMRHAEVTPDGRYTKRQRAEGSGGDKLSYGTMVMVRALLVGDFARGLSEAVTVATRYSAIRLQGERQDGSGGEVKIIDYPTQQYKIAPPLAAAYAMYFCGEKLRNDYFDVAAEVSDGKLDRLPEVHALSSCMKAFCAEVMTEGIEICRRSCGGHGYSLASGIPQMFMALSPGCTFEGENTVLYLQTGRYLLKCYQSVLQQKVTELPASVSYLTTDIHGSANPKSVDDLEWLVIVHQLRVKRMLWHVGREFTSMVRNGLPWHEAFQRMSIRLVRLSRAHAQQYLLWSLVKVVRSAPPNLCPVLAKLAALLALHTIVEESGEFLQTNAIDADCRTRCEAALERCLGALRPDLVALVDSFDLPDSVLNSVLGRYDGQVYDNLFEWAQRSPMNREEVNSAFHTTIRPLMRGEPLPPLSKL